MPPVASPVMPPVASPVASPVKFDVGSFRDRSARVFESEQAIYRTLNQESSEAWKRVSCQDFFQRRMSTGQIIPTTELSDSEIRRFLFPTEVTGVLKHERIPFISYPYEWPFALLKRATLLQLDLLAEAMTHQVMLKDSTPYNIQFRGTQPVFIDIGSFIPLVPNEPWLAYRQFCELMLFPLLLQAYRGIHFQSVLRAQLEGIPAKQFLQWIRWRDLFRPGVFTNGWLHAALERNAQQVSTSTVTDLKSSGFQSQMIQQMLKKLTRLVERLEWNPAATQWAATQWANYDESLPHVAEDLQAKSDFVRNVCQTHRRTLVWDLGCNDGRFSRIASEFATTVIALDQDHGCIERLCKSLEPEQRVILPLCMDLANPSPGQGWRGQERRRLEERGEPDLVLCLGLIHHLVLAANIPLPDVVGWLASLGGELLLEFPSKRDAMVKGLLRNKRDQYADYSLEHLVQELQKSFQIVRQVSLPSGERTLFHAIPQGKSKSADGV